MKLFQFLLGLIFILAIYPYNTYADVTYVVKNGDNLYRISKHFKVKPEKITEANKLGSSRLKIGAHLIIPSRTSVSDSNISRHIPQQKKGNEPASQIEDSTNEAQYHKVRKGETLAFISKKYSISIEELRDLNNLKKSVKLKRGQHLIVKRTGPRTYTAKKGDNIWKIAKKFNISADELMAINEIEPEELKPGQKLFLEETEEQTVNETYTTMLSQAKLEDIKQLSQSEEAVSLSVKDRISLFSKKMLNIPYRFGGSTFMGIDCSAYVQKVYSFLNVPLPRTAREQFKIGEAISKDELSIGDLVFFRTYASFPSHVGIYLGNNLFIHASSKDKMVTINSLDKPYFVKRFIGAKRLLSDEAEAEEKQPEENIN